MQLIDWDRLMSLREDIGEEDFADVAFVFFVEIDTKLKEMGKAPSATTSEDFHFLRGSAANLGFAAMAEACEAAEAACLEGCIPELFPVVSAFEDALAEVRPRLPEIDAA